MIRTLDPGFLTTVQDLPRLGGARYGLSEAGASIPLSLWIANRLAQNSKVLPSLEITLKPPRLLFQQGAVLGFGGADFGWRVDGRAIDPRRTVTVRAGATLSGDYCRTGLRGILAFGGGLEVEPWMGSASTHVDAGLGGRVLQRNDVMMLRQPSPTEPLSPQFLRETPPPPITANGYKLLRILPGPHVPLFPAEALSLLAGAVYRVTEQSSRVALRVDGLALPSPAAPIASCGVWNGAIQVPPGGVPQVLGCEHPATGGYPILASVIEADWETLGQLRPREEFRFGLVSPATALALRSRVREWQATAFAAALPH
ncbi:MAG: biotin-dependent carboxyltransferase family protein [Bryobacter sp.]|nr:biotin-dependent carboxyltransferase family protein [Bryobacter sp.]